MRFRRRCADGERARRGEGMRGWRYRRAVMVLREGGVVAYPTEAVYGIGCDPLDRAGVARVFAIKHRPPHKRCILIAADPRHLEPFVAAAAPEFREHAARYWPGPVTLVAPARDEAPAWLVAATGTVAVRVTDHPVAHDLCASFGGALVSTSANRSACPPVRDALRARAVFGDEIDWYVPGRVGGLTAPTRIIDIRDGRTVRG